MIRRAEVKDAPQIHYLLTIIFDLHKNWHPDIFDNSGSKYSLEKVKEKIKNSEEDIFVFDYKGKIIGYLFGYLKDNYYFVDDICVDPDYRGKGVGKNLINHLNEKNEIRLNVWCLNREALAFYESLGFSPLTTILRRPAKVS